MRRPGVPQTPRSHEPNDRGAATESKRDHHASNRGQEISRKERKQRVEERRRQQAGKSRGHVEGGHDSPHQNDKSQDGRAHESHRGTGIAREAHDQRREFGKAQGRESHGTKRESGAFKSRIGLPGRKPSKAVEKSQPNNVSRYSRGGLRRYFTPKRASQTFGSHERTIELEERRSELKSARRKAIATRVGIALATIAVLAGIAWVVFFSPVFALSASKVKITGLNEDVAEVEVQDKLAPFIGTPLPRMAMTSVENAVGSVVQIESVKAQRAWPEGLDISVTVRKPIAAIQEGGEFQVIDRDAVVLKTVPEKPEDLILVELNVDSEEQRAQAMNRIATVSAEIPKELSERVDLMIGDALTVELRTNDGRVIKWGDESDSKLKADVVLLLLEQRPAQVYDVSTPSRPVTS
ncbi:MAG: FtsQ-type POTRA domain-containing protein [Gleimia sp.]|jgi:cell division protein FtsQ|nr:FtsQ-type POTRA domain-containing protein [Acidobacteriota bacterium]